MYVLYLYHAGILFDIAAVLFVCGGDIDVCCVLVCVCVCCVEFLLADYLPLIISYS